MGESNAVAAATDRRSCIFGVVKRSLRNRKVSEPGSPSNTAAIRFTFYRRDSGDTTPHPGSESYGKVVLSGSTPARCCCPAQTGGLKKDRL